jgi:single-strand DNA-binding protein
LNLRLPEQNQVLLTGNLTRDPELRYTGKGTAMCRFRMGANRRYKDTASGEWKDDPTFVNIVVWREIAESCGKRLKKGSPVHVEGRLRSYEYEDKDKVGAKRSVIEVEARRVQFLEKPDSARAESGPAELAPAASLAVASEADIEEVPF